VPRCELSPTAGGRLRIAARLADADNLTALLEALAVAPVGAIGR
jgi:hypothetical protein